MTDVKKTTVSGICCPRCLSHVWSRHRHDMRYCPCEYSFVDGGRDYTRVGYGVKPRKYTKTGKISKSEYKWMDEMNTWIGSPLMVDLVIAQKKREEK